MNERVIALAVWLALATAPVAVRGQVIEPAEREEEAAMAEDAMEEVEMTTRIRVGGSVRLEGPTGPDARSSPGRPVVLLESTGSNLMIDGTVEVDDRGRWIAFGTLHGPDSAGVAITADAEGFVFDREPVLIHLSPSATRELGVRLILESRELARTRLRQAGDARARRVMNASSPDSTTVLEVLDFYDRALRFRPARDVHWRKTDFLARVGWYRECMDAFDDWIAYRRENGLTEESTEVWYGRLVCARRQAVRTRELDDWREVMETARRGLERDVTGRVRFWSNWLAALLNVTGSGGDYWEFGERAAEQPGILEEWTDLYYRHYRGRDPESELSPRDITCGAIALAWTTGLTPRKTGCPASFFS